MGLFDKLKRGKSNLTIDAIIGEEYEQQYFDECKYIWKNYVPQAGQADKLQGELLREIEKTDVKTRTMEILTGMMTIPIFVILSVEN